jgi:hypothetical protein
MDTPQAPAGPSTADPAAAKPEPHPLGPRLRTRLRRLVKVATQYAPGGNRRNRASTTVASLLAEPPPHGRGRWYRTIIGVDIIGFGRRDEDLQNYVRAKMYEILPEAFAEGRVPWPAQEWREDRGDGVLMTVPADVPAHIVIDLLVQHLPAGLRRHNKVSSADAQINLRTAIHAGFISRDEHGLSGEAIVHLYRLLDAQAFKEVVAEQRPTLGLAASNYIHHHVIRPDLGVTDPDSYAKIHVNNKETTTDAWVHLVNCPYRSKNY